MLAPADRKRVEAMLAAIEQAKAARRPATPPELDFIRSLQIEDKVSGGLIHFDLWPFQEDLITVLNNEEFWTFVLKARQLGITWTVEAHLLSFGTFWGNRLFLIYSQSGKDSADALDRIRIMIQSIPEIWRPKIVKDNAKEIVLDNGSRYQAMMATSAPAAVSRRSPCFVTRWAPGSGLRTRCRPLRPARNASSWWGRGKGKRVRCQKMWRLSQARKGRCHSVFYPWHVHPDRDENWYQTNVVDLRAAACSPRVRRHRRGSLRSA